MAKAKTKKAAFSASPLHMPEVKTLAELFEIAEAFETDSRTMKVLNKGRAATTSRGQKIGPYCMVTGHPTGHQSLWVRPTAMLIEFVEKTMMPIVEGSVFFDLVWHGDEVLVIVKYDQIIGSRWLTKIPASELARFGWKDDD